MRRSFLCLLIMAGLFSTMSCSVNTNNSSTSGVVISGSQSNIENKIIDALENQDAEAIKGVFSKLAVERSADLDSEIEKMLSIYKGKYEKITHKNFGQSKQAGENAYQAYTPVCVFKTSEGYYKLTWDEYTVNEKNPDLVGVYSMKFETWDDEGTDQGGADLNLAGLFSSDSSDEIELTHELFSIFSSYDLVRIGHKDNNLLTYKDDLNDLLSDELLSSVNDEQIDRFFENIIPFAGLKSGYAWISYDQNKEKTICMLSDSDKYEGCFLCIRPDKNRKGKISSMIVGKMKDGQKIDDYISQMQTSEIKIIS